MPCLAATGLQHVVMLCRSRSDVEKDYIKQWKEITAQDGRYEESCRPMLPCQLEMLGGSTSIGSRSASPVRVLTTAHSVSAPTLMPS